MRYFFLIFLFFFLLNCSFDNKSGIWTDQSNNQKKTEIFKNFEKISVSEPQFKKIILADNDLIFKLTKPKINYQWNDVFYQENNNFDNFNYSDLNKRIFNVIE